MDAKPVTLGPAGSLGIYIVRERMGETDGWTDRQRGRYEGNQRKKITSTSISQGPFGVSLNHWAPHTHAYRIKTHRHIHMLLISENPLWQNLPSFHNLISNPCFSIQCEYGWGKCTAALALFSCSICPHRSHFPNFAPHIFALSWSWWDWKSKPILILSGSRSVLPLYLSVCRVQGRALTLFSQRIRHAECWGLLHTKRAKNKKKKKRDLSVDSRAVIGYEV